MFCSPFHRVAVCAIGTLAFTATGTFAQCEKDWIGGEAVPGTDGPVGASMVWDPDGSGPLPPVLLVAGDFTFAGVAAAPRIAAWDGSAWTAPFGDGLNGVVRALTVYNGQLIAAGEFTHAGGPGGADGVPAARIARWDGSAWLPLSSGIDGPVYALAVSHGLLYAGGAFATAGGVAVSNIASWDGATWSPVGASAGAGGVDAQVNALADFDGSLYVGGLFTHADGMAASGIASWSGTAWSPLSSGVSPPDVRTLLVDGGFVYAAGGFTNAGGATHYAVARFDGANWSAAGAGIYRRQCVRYTCHNYVEPVRALAREGNLIYAALDTGAGGGVAMRSFNGSAWSVVPGLVTVAALPAPVATLIGFNGELYLGGNFGGAGSPQNIARFDGTAWDMLSGMNGQIADLVPFAGGVVATGTFTELEGVAANHVALWDGTHWSALGSGTVNAYSAMTFGGNLYVSAFPGGVLQWDGSTWTTLYGAGLGGGAPAMGTYNGHIVAGLSSSGFSVPEGNSSSVGMWNGSTWEPLGETGGVYVGPGTFATIGNTLYAAGYFAPSSTVGSFSGGDWNAIDTTPIGFATTLVVHAGSLYAASTTDAGTGVVARFVGNTFQPLPGTFDIAPVELASIAGELYAAGNFADIDGVPFNGVARFDGAAWQPLGIGAQSGSVLALAGLNGNILAGGTFVGIGGKGFRSFATYGCVLPPPPPPPPACPADFNADGLLNADDLADFITGYFNVPADPRTDFNGDGSINADDLGDFVTAYFNGC